MSDSTLRDLVRARGTELSTEKKDSALDALLDSSAQLTALVDAGKIPTTFVTGLSDWLSQVVSDVEMGQPIPPLGTNTGKDSVKPEHRRVLQALERGELKLDPSTGLPEAADSSADIDNTLTALERELGSGRVSGDDNPTRLRRVTEEVKKNRTASDKLGDTAEALGLKKDAKPDDIVANAKDAHQDSEAVGNIAEALGLAKDAKSDDIVAAAKAAKAGVPAKSGGRLRIPGTGRS
jgi:hypothetical protein